MTVQDFYDRIEYVSDLIDFCREHDCGLCDDIYDDDARDSYIDEEAKDRLAYYGWRDAQNYLSSFEDYRADWWLLNDYGEWYAFDDDDFEERKEDVLTWAIEEGIVTPDEEDEETDAVYAAEEEPAPEDYSEYEAPEFDTDELFADTASSFAESQAAAAIAAQAAEEAAAALAEYAAAKREEEAREEALERAAEDARWQAASDADFASLFCCLEPVAVNG